MNSVAFYYVYIVLLVCCFFLLSFIFSVCLINFLSRNHIASHRIKLQLKLQWQLQLMWWYDHHSFLDHFFTMVHFLHRCCYCWIFAFINRTDETKRRRNVKISTVLFNGIRYQKQKKCLSCTRIIHTQYRHIVNRMLCVYTHTHTHFFHSFSR